MYIPQVPASAAPVVTPPTATSAAMPAIPVTAGYVPALRPFFVPAAKPMDPNAVADHNKVRLIAFCFQMSQAVHSQKGMFV